ANHMVERGAGRLVVAAVHQRGGPRTMVHREFEHELVDRLGRQPGLHHVAELVEAFGDELPRLADAGEGLGAGKLDLSGLAQRRKGGIDVVHGEMARFTGNLVIEAREATSKAYAAILPPSSSSMCTRTISSNESSTLNPSERARRASKRVGQPET